MLPLPLHCYEESGRIKPPRWLPLILALGCKDILLVIAAMTLPEHTSRLLSILYQSNTHMAWQLLLALPFVVVFAMVSFREKLFKKGCSRWANWVRPLCIGGFTFDLANQGYSLQAIHWQFSLHIGVFIMLYGLAIMTVVRSRHLKLMQIDWRKG